MSDTKTKPKPENHLSARSSKHGKVLPRSSVMQTKYGKRSTNPDTRNIDKDFDSSSSTYSDLSSKAGINYQNESKFLNPNLTAQARIHEQQRKKRLEISADLHDVTACMTSALDSLKFEVLVARPLDPTKSESRKMKEEAKMLLSYEEEKRVEDIMDDEANLHITRTGRLCWKFL